MRVLVCGGRHWTDRGFIYQTLDRLRRGWGPDVTIIEGDARGVDRIAGYWARRNKLTNLKFRADWETHGVLAGPIRNKQMLDEGQPDLVVVFPGGRGTLNMKTQAIRANVPVIHIEAPVKKPEQQAYGEYR